MEIAKVTSKGQITIPVSIRRRLGINEGDKLLFIDRPEGVIMVNPNMFQSEDGDLLNAESYAGANVPDLSVKPDALSSAGGSVHTAAAQNENTDTKAKGFDVAAILNEIRSIGSKI